jgi:hypothetical protein
MINHKEAYNLCKRKEGSLKGSLLYFYARIM